MSDQTAERIIRQWHTDDPKRLVKRGHPAGDLLDAYKWEVLERGKGRLRVRAALPERLRNPRGTLFGGFTPTYVDFISLHTFHTDRDPDEPRRWLNTTHMSVEYFAPITGPTFEMVCEVVSKGGRTGHVQTKFIGEDGTLCALAFATFVQRRE